MAIYDKCISYTSTRELNHQSEWWHGTDFPSIRDQETGFSEWLTMAEPAERRGKLLSLFRSTDNYFQYRNHRHQLFSYLRTECLHLCRSIHKKCTDQKHSKRYYRSCLRAGWNENFSRSSQRNRLYGYRPFGSRNLSAENRPPCIQIQTTMKRIILLSGICALCIQSILAQEKMFVHRSDKITQGVLLSVLDSMTFVNEAVLLHLHDQDAPTYSMTEIDSLSFGDNSLQIKILYSDTGIEIVNP